MQPNIISLLPWPHPTHTHAFAPRSPCCRSCILRVAPPAAPAVGGCTRSGGHVACGALLRVQLCGAACCALCAAAPAVGGCTRLGGHIACSAPLCVQLCGAACYTLHAAVWRRSTCCCRLAAWLGGMRLHASSTKPLQLTHITQHKWNTHAHAHARTQTHTHPTGRLRHPGRVHLLRAALACMR